MVHLYIRVCKTIQSEGLWSVSNSLDCKTWIAHKHYDTQDRAIDHAFARAVNWERITGGTSGVTIDPREHKEASAYA